MLNFKNKSIYIIDMHVHAFPDEVAGRAIESLYTAYNIKPKSDGTIDSLVLKMNSTGVDLAVLQPVATKSSQVRSINNWAASHKSDQIISFGGIHPDFEDIPGEIERIIELGIKGIKIQGNWQDVAIDNPRMYPIYEAAEGRLIMMFHSGAEISPFEEMKATPKQLSNVINNFPKLSVIAAHMGGYLMWDEAEKYLVGKDIYLDTSSCFRELIDDRNYVRLIRKHGIDRILFASDMPLGDPETDIKRFIELGFSDNELESILYRNAKKLLNI